MNRQELDRLDDPRRVREAVRRMIVNQELELELELDPVPVVLLGPGGQFTRPWPRLLREDDHA